MYRLHIDIPLNCDEETAKQAGLDAVNAILAVCAAQNSKIVVDTISTETILNPMSPSQSVTQINYRLGCDEDRQKSNYYVMDSKGHVTHKKCVIRLSEDVVSHHGRIETL
jgi:6-phosphofructokinase